MKYAWLEKLAENGSISQETKAQIYADCEELIKIANASPKEMMADALKAMMAAGGVLALEQGVEGAFNKYDQWKGREQIEKVKAKFMADPEYQLFRDKVDARCNEIAQLAPHVAMNEALMKKFLPSRIQSGITDEDAQKLTQIQSHYTPNLRNQQGYQPKMASVSPHAAGEILADVYCLVKTASPELNKKLIGDFLLHSAVYATVPLLAGIAAGGVNLAMNKLDNKKLQGALEDSFQRAIMLSNPDEGLREKQEKAREAFQALAHFAPHVAAQPQAARAFMAKLISFDQGLHTSDLRDLTEIEKNLMMSKKTSPFLSGLGAGMHAAGAEKLVSHATETVMEPFGKLYKQEVGANIGVKSTPPKGATGT